MAIQIIQGKIDTDPFQDMGGAKYTKISMTEAEANMSAGMSINLGRIKPASEQIDNGEYKSDTYTKPVSLFERRRKGRVEYRSPNQSSAQSRPMTLTQHPRIVDDTDMSESVNVSSPVNEVHANIDTNLSSNVTVLGSVDELYEDIDKSIIERKCVLETFLLLEITEHDRLTPDDLDRCDELDKMYAKTKDAHHLFDKYSLLEKHLTNLEDSIEDRYFLRCVPDELICHVASKSGVVSGNTEELVSSLDNRARLLILLSVTPTRGYRDYLSADYVVDVCPRSSWVF